MKHRHPSHCNACHTAKTNTGSLCFRCIQIKHNYCVDPVDIHKLLIKQQGTCAICGRFPPSHRKLAVDHDSHNGKVRGLLCTQCNFGIGYLRTPAILTKAIEYLNKPYPILSYYDPRERRKDYTEAIQVVLNNHTLPTLRSKARALGEKERLSEHAALARVRRFIKKRDIFVSPKNATLT